MIAYIARRRSTWKRAQPRRRPAHRADRGRGRRRPCSSEDELIEQVMLLYIAGHETTVNLIGNGTLALLRNRDQLELLRADPTLDANAVDELLRYDSPVQFSRRITLDRRRDRRPHDRAGQLRHDVPRRRQPRPGALGRRPPTSSTSAAPTRPSTCRSAAACTTASARRSPSRGSRRDRQLVRRFPDLELATDRRSGTAAWCSVASTSSP